METLMNDLSGMPIETLSETIISCRKCERLVAWREAIAARKTLAYQSWEYWGKPVPGLGDINGRVLVLGLAPGAHGSNRTGRMFTGDGSGDFLFPALHRAGYANQSQSTAIGDGLQLNDMFITAVCRCVPPENTPARGEIMNCIPYAKHEMELMQNLKMIVTLGSIAHNEIIRHFGMIYPGQKIGKFKHNGLTVLPDVGIAVLSSYHPSRQNTQTGRLTVAMFDDIWRGVNAYLER